MSKNIQHINKLFEEARIAQEQFSKFTQEQVDKIFYEVAKAANEKRIDLAELAVEETQRGILEDKISKNHVASELMYHQYKNTKTVGVLTDDDSLGYREIAEPVGVIAAIIPVTNPTSTTIFKTLISLKTRNGIVICPHPQAKKCTYETAMHLAKVAEEAGAPKGIIQCVDEPSMDGTSEAMKVSDLILATGGGGLVKAAYSSGTPAIGVGAGNAPAIIDSSADLDMAVSSIIQSNVFDNGMVCATENSVIVLDDVYEEVKKLFEKRSAYIVSKPDQIKKVEKGMFQEGKFGLLHPAPVGQKPVTVAKHFGFKVPENTKLILVEGKGTKHEDALAHEKLSTYVTLYRASDFNDALDKSEDLLKMGAGHTASLHVNEGEKDKISQWSNRLKAGRLVINTPSSLGGVGDLYNFGLAPSLTLGCGSWGGNGFIGQVGPMELLNIKRVAMRRENTLWLKVPRTYFKEGSTPEALKDLVDEGVKKIFIVSDAIIWQLYGKKMSQYLTNLGFDFRVFTDVEPNPTLGSVQRGLGPINEFKPDVILGFGGGSPMDAGKLMWFMHENPGQDFKDLALTFFDIRKRIVKYPQTGKNVKFIAIPTTAGTGSEVTPFSVITDEKEGKKYPLADYALLPYMAIVDAQFQMSMPKSVTAISGMDALTHAIEAYVSILASEFTKPYALEAIRIIFEYLPRAYKNGAADKEARSQMAHAATISGIAFANAFLGIVHSMSHKLGGVHHVAHGHANSIFLPYVIKYNSLVNENGKQGLFAQNKTPDTKHRYAEIAKYLGLKGTSDEALTNSLIDAIVKLAKSIGMTTDIKSTLPETSEKDFKATIKQMARDSYDDQCTGANPRQPLIKDLEKLFDEAWKGNDPKKIKF